MSDVPRLAELERQRAVIAAHLKWLDDEIARERHAAASSARPGSQPNPATALPRVREPIEPVASASVTAVPPGEAEVVPLHEPDPLPSKWGCWIAFAAMMLGLATAVGLFIYFGYGGAPESP